MSVASVGDAGAMCLGYFGGVFSSDARFIMAHGFTGEPLALLGRRLCRLRCPQEPAGAQQARSGQLSPLGFVTSRSDAGPAGAPTPRPQAPSTCGSARTPKRSHPSRSRLRRRRRGETAAAPPPPGRRAGGMRWRARPGCPATRWAATGTRWWAWRGAATATAC